MVPAVGGIAHGVVNERRRAERARTDHRRWWRPWLAAPRMTIFFITTSHGGLLGYTPTPRSIFMVPAVGGVAHGVVNERRRAERARMAHRRKNIPWPLTPIVSPRFRVTKKGFSFFSPRL